MLFLDIETAPLYRKLEEVPEPLRTYWLDRYSSRKKPSDTRDDETFFLEESGIHALYSRVVCIGLGFFHRENADWHWRAILLKDLDEKKLLQDFVEKWNSTAGYFRGKCPNLAFQEPLWAVCGHNIRNFDLPFLGRRLVWQKLPLPPFWQAAQDSQPWQLKNPTVIDTMLLWSFTSWDSGRYIPLEMLAYAVGIAFQKSLTHTDIREAFYRWQDTGDENAFEPVVQYCLQDVRTTAEIFVRLQVPLEEQEPLLQALAKPSNPAL